MFWETFVELCIEHNTKPNPVAKKLGISSGTVTNWKKEHATPHSVNLKKIADYFGVNSEYFFVKRNAPETLGAVSRDAFADTAEKSSFSDFGKEAKKVFYEKYLELCQRKNKKPTSVALEIGISRGAVTNWKKGGIPNDITLKKIAEYFNVTINCLLGNEGVNISGNSLNGTYNMVGNSANMNIDSGNELTEQEKELIFIYRKLNAVDKAKTLLYAVELNEKWEE